MHRPRTIAALLLAAACGPRPLPEDPGDTNTTTTSETTPVTAGPTTDATPTSTDVSTTAPTSAANTSAVTTSAADTSDDSGQVFIATPDVPPPGFPDCNLAEPDCPDGFKCNPSGIRDSSIFTGKPQCVPLVPDAKPHGAPCSVFDDPLDGTDDCEAGVVCLFPDPEGEGMCHALCDIEGGAELGPPCAPDLTCFGALCQSCFWGYCDVPCDPRVLDVCDPGQVCGSITFDAWGCILDASGDEGQAGDPCQFSNACDPGHFCMDADQVVGCADTTGCCAPMCSTDAPNSCPGAAQGETCVAWYGPGDAPPQLETLGVCAVPL